MDTRGPGPHLGLPLAPIDEYLQAVKAHLRIAVRGVHAFIPVNPHIDFVQALFRHSDGIAVAEDGISFAVFTILLGRGHLHQPQLAPKAPGVNDKVGDLHRFSFPGGAWPLPHPFEITSPCVVPIIPGKKQNVVSCVKHLKGRKKPTPLCCIGRRLLIGHSVVRCQKGEAPAVQQVVGFVYGVAMLRRLVPHIELRERCIKQLPPLL